MAKATKAASTAKTKVEKILISQPKPESEKSPYFDIAKKHNVKIDFHQFIKLEPLNAKEFRKQKIELAEYTAVILNSRNAVDHFFRVCEEMKFKVSQEMRYFCITEAIALYLQKFILYRKRKVFFSADGSVDGLMDVLSKYKDKEKFLIPVSENTKNDISPTLNKLGFNYSEAIVYRTVGNGVADVLNSDDYDLVVMFSPFGVDALNTEVPDFQERPILYGAFGHSAATELEKLGVDLAIKAPAPGTPSISSALDKFLTEKNK